MKLRARPEHALGFFSLYLQGVKGHGRLFADGEFARF